MGKHTPKWKTKKAKKRKGDFNKEQIKGKNRTIARLKNEVRLIKFSEVEKFSTLNCKVNLRKNSENKYLMLVNESFAGV